MWLDPILSHHLYLPFALEPPLAIPLSYIVSPTSQIGEVSPRRVVSHLFATFCTNGLVMTCTNGIAKRKDPPPCGRGSFLILLASAKGEGRRYEPAKAVLRGFGEIYESLDLGLEISPAIAI